MYLIRKSIFPHLAAGTESDGSFVPSPCSIRNVGITKMYSLFLFLAVCVCVWFIKRPARPALTLLPSTLITLMIITEGPPLVVSKSYFFYGARH